MTRAGRVWSPGRVWRRIRNLCCPRPPLQPPTPDDTDDTDNPDDPDDPDARDFDSINTWPG